MNVMEEVLTRLWQYGIPTPPHDGPSDIWTLLLRQAPRCPIRVYAIAAAYAMEPVCVAASGHTLEVSMRYPLEVSTV